MSTIFITGCNRGIGNALLKSAAKCGYSIIAHARNKTTNFYNEIEILKQKYNIPIRPIYFDITNSDAMKDSIKLLIKDKVKIDALVNCAGISHGGYFQMTSIDEIKKIFETNFFAQLELTQLISRIMIKQKSGNIVNIGSAASFNCDAGSCAYATSKSALMAWTKILAKELAPYNIRVNAIAPGIVQTDMGMENSKQYIEHIISSTLLKRIATAEEIADVILFLVSEKSSYINGEIMKIDGGRI